MYIYLLLVHVMLTDGNVYTPIVEEYATLVGGCCEDKEILQEVLTHNELSSNIRDIHIECVREAVPYSM